MSSPQAGRVILTLFLAVLAQCNHSAAQGVVTQTGTETIESYDSATEVLTVSVEYSYEWPSERTIRSFSVPPPEDLIGEVSFSPTGTGGCTRVNARTIRCPSFTTSFSISYRYLKQVFATEDEKENFNYRSDWGFHGRTANTTLDLFYPPSLVVCRDDPCNAPNPEPNIDEPGHLQWVEENENSRFLAEVRFQVGPLEPPSCPAGMTLAASQSCVNVSVAYFGETQCNASDSGFDATNAPSGSPWISVAQDETTLVAKAEITPAENAGDVEFVSDDPEIATVTSQKASQSPRSLSVVGIAPGETSIDAVVNQTLGQSLNVAVYQKKTLKIAMHIITAIGDVPPTLNISDSALKEGLDRIWDQAAITFTVKKRQLSVNYDTAPKNGLLDGICESPGTLFSETEGRKIVRDAKDPTAHINLFYIKDLAQDKLQGCASSIQRIAFIQDVSFPLHVIDVTAHEVGHVLRNDHVNDKSRLMHPDGLESAGNCLLVKPEWDTSNETAQGFK